MMKTKEKERIQRAFKETMDYEEILKCTRCGFCLPSCPTYIETGYDEVHSPRGRIALMKGLVDGDIEPSEEMKRTIDLCLGCRACETACPSGVKFGRLLEQAREAIYQSQQQGMMQKFVRKITFDYLFLHQERMVGVTSLLGFYQRSGLQKTARTLGIMKLFPEPLRTMEKVLPNAPKKKEMKGRQRYFSPARERKIKVAFFSGCLMDTMFQTTNDATTKLLQYAGCEIVVPEEQGCCVALHGHSGEQEKARELAKRNITAFEASNVDYIITNAGGCGGFLNDYGYLLKDDPEWAERADKFGSKITDVTSILVELDFHHFPLALNEQTVTYQDSCHLKNGQQTYIQPRTLLQSIDGVDYVELKNADHCCGSAGIYNIVESEMSIQILDKKMESVLQSQAKTIVTTNPGCLLQMKLGIERAGLSKHMEAVHIVDFLLKAYLQANETESY